MGRQVKRAFVFLWLCTHYSSVVWRIVDASMVEKRSGATKLFFPAGRNACGVAEVVRIIQPAAL